MNEIIEIINAYHAAKENGKKVALATVVQVNGSSYRRAGARMLVTEDGLITGAISGGCLEGDALRKALLAINEKRNKIVTYDTDDEDDAKLGLQLGCSGTIYILFEPIAEDAINNPLQLLQHAADQTSKSVLVTLFSLQNNAAQPGTGFFISSNEIVTNKAVTIAPHIAADIHRTALATLKEGGSHTMDHSLSCGLFAFIELIVPIASLIVFGAGNDVIPLVEIAEIAGFRVTVVDGRSTHATKSRFPQAHNLIVAKAEHALAKIQPTETTAFVLMTHNYNYDIEVLRQLSGITTPYIGVLGPRKKFQRMMDDLSINESPDLTNMLSNVYSPVGLDLGGDTAADIAVSIVAEIKSVMNQRNAQSLRNKSGGIHDETTV